MKSPSPVQLFKLTIPPPGYDETAEKKKHENEEKEFFNDFDALVLAYREKPIEKDNDNHKKLTGSEKES